MELKQWFACLKKGNTPHGVLLAGPEGSGKKDYARQAAALYLKGTAEPEALTDCPYFREMEDTSIETLRDCCAELNQQAFGRGRRCLLLPDAHLLDMRTQNTLLKTLEEPPEEALLVLTGNEEGLLPTIRSRCVEWKLRGEDEDARDDAARDLCRAFASGQLLPVSQYLVGLENKRLKREQLQQLLENAWRASAEALLAACGKPDPADIPGAEELRRGLTVRQLQGMTDLMKQYCLECRYNVGVGHVLGALCAGWEKLL